MPCSTPPLRVRVAAKVPPYMRRRLRAGAAAAVAVLAVFALSLPAESPVPEAVTVDLHADGGSPRPVPREVPKSKPNQRQAPCAPGEVEAFGLCWFSLENKPPHCPGAALAHAGRCLLASEMTTRIPNTVDH